MIELSNTVIERILHKETAKKEDTQTILRSVYTRYMRLYEKYFSDIDALSDGTVAGLRQYHEETRSLVKYYYMDIPLDICMKLEAFDERFSGSLLGPAWRASLFGFFDDFTEKHEDESLSEASLKAEFAKQALKAFYDDMNYVFREGFGTGSQTAETVVSGLAELLLGKSE